MHPLCAPKKRGEEGKGEGLLIIPIKLRSLWGFSRGEHHLVLQAFFQGAVIQLGLHEIIVYQLSMPSKKKMAILALFVIEEVHPRII